MNDLKIAEKETFLELPVKTAAKPLPFHYAHFLPDKLLERKGTLRFIDILATAFFGLSMYIGFWRGAFGIIYAAGFDLYQLTFLFVIGSLMNVYFMLMADIYEKYLSKTTCSQLIFKVIYIYTTEMGLILQWAGFWFMMEIIIGMRVMLLAFSSVTSALVLLVMRSGVNSLTAPFKVVSMNRKFTRRLKTEKTADKGSKLDSLFILDSLFSVFVVGCLVVFAWRGVWCLFDIYLYPGDEVISAVISLILGYVIVFIVFGLQSPMKKCCGKLNGLARLAVLDVYIFISFLGTINVWRGLWNLLNIYFLPESPSLSCWITHIGCFVFLVIINCSNSVLVRGVAVDGEEEGGKCVVFMTSYLRTLLSDPEKREEENQDQPVRNKTGVAVSNSV